MGREINLLKLVKFPTLLSQAGGVAQIRSGRHPAQQRK
jgi:hypothetical protein